MTSHCIVSGQRVMAGKTELYGGGFSGIMHTELCPGSKARMEL